MWIQGGNDENSALNVNTYEWWKQCDGTECEYIC